MTLRPIAAAFLLAATFSGDALAAPCADFMDVEDDHPFCKHVEWIKNRGVTLGCETNKYCPHDPVSRLQMAAFMNRLGTALTPLVLKREVASGPQDLDTTPVVCATDDQVIENFPRSALLDVAVSATAPGDVDFTVRAVYSTNGGTSWQPVAALASVALAPVVQWGQATDFGSVDLDVGQTVRFGAQLGRIGGGSTDLADTRCLVRVQVINRDGVTSPL